MAQTADRIRLKLEKRHQERLKAFEKRRQERRKDRDDKADVADAFLLAFNEEKTKIVHLLNSLDSGMAKMDLMQRFDEVMDNLQKLEKFVGDSACNLPSYDVRRAQDILKQIRNDVSTSREQLLPRKKFAFKSRTKVTDKKDIESTDTTPALSQSYNDSSIVGFSDRTGEELSLSATECSCKDVSLRNIEDCTIRILGSPSAVQIRNIVNSTIYFGPVSRAVFIYDCVDSTFHIACQQLRIHATSNTKFYIHVTSKAIIEDCFDVGFGQYKLCYEGMDEHYERSGLDRNTNNWEHTDDFNWLKLDEQSPNWYKIDQSDEIHI